MFFNSPNLRKNSLIHWAKNHRIDFPSKPEDLEQVQKLDLEMKGVTKIPKEIDCLTNLVVINTSFNELTELPWEFGHLKKLKVVNLSNNNFIDVPGVICQLNQLEMLNMTGNSIKKIQPVIGNLINLIELNLSFNQIVDISNEIMHLKHLNVLNLSGNNIVALPSSMQKLYNLVELILWKNKFTEVPEYIKELPNLKITSMEPNNLAVNQQLIAAVIKNDIEKVEKLLVLGADVNYQWPNFKNQQFTTALFEAKSPDIIEFLINYGADTSVKREVLKIAGDKSKADFETFFTKKHSPEVMKFLKTFKHPTS